tara:strand:- start:492 stop:1049 length:558 start_codon:yes stop_codon:yes gene_type:complete
MFHFVNKKSLFDNYPQNYQEIILGAGCFWGVEKIFWGLNGIWVTYASFSGGQKSNPSYEEVCAGITGHAETVNIIYDHKKISTQDILKNFWECHDPTQGMRQGNDMGEQYRSVIFCTNDEQLELAMTSKQVYEKILSSQGYERITTEIQMKTTSYPAEEYHQQYLAKNPNGYCGIKGTGCALPPL